MKRLPLWCSLFALFLFCNGAVIIVALLLPGQTRVDSGLQVSPRPSIVFAEFKCTTGNPDCIVGFVRIKFSDGRESKLFTVPTDPAFVPGPNWTSIPVTLPAGPTAIPCSQTKP